MRNDDGQRETTPKQQSQSKDVVVGSKNLFDKYIVISSNGKYVLPKLVLNFGCGILQLSMNLNASK